MSRPTDASREWGKMFASHLRSARLAVKCAKAAVRVLEEKWDREVHRGRRHFHRAMSLSAHETDENRAHHEAAARRPYVSQIEESIVAVRESIARAELMLEEAEAHLAKLATEEKERRKVEAALRVLSDRGLR